MTFSGLLPVLVLATFSNIIQEQEEAFSVFLILFFLNFAKFFSHLIAGVSYVITSYLMKGQNGRSLLLLRIQV